MSVTITLRRLSAKIPRPRLLSGLLVTFGVANLVVAAWPYIDYWMMLIGVVDMQLAAANVRLGQYLYVLAHEAVTSFPTIVGVAFGERPVRMIGLGVLPIAAGLNVFLVTRRTNIGPPMSQIITSRLSDGTASVLAIVIMLASWLGAIRLLLYHAPDLIIVVGAMMLAMAGVLVAGLLLNADLEGENHE